MNIYFPTVGAKAEQPHPISKNSDDVFVIPIQHNGKVLQLLQRNTEINTINTLTVCVSQLRKSYQLTIFLVYLMNGDFSLSCCGLCSLVK